MSCVRLHGIIAWSLVHLRATYPATVFAIYDLICRRWTLVPTKPRSTRPCTRWKCLKWWKLKWKPSAAAGTSLAKSAELPLASGAARQHFYW